MEPVNGDPTDADASPERTFIAGIGASAGGLEALERFFERAPTDSGIAWVVVQHLSPDLRSLMPELLGRCTPLPIRRVEDGMAVQADHVYLIPPGKEMIVSEGRLLLTGKGRDHELSLPVDTFFRSLARDLGDRAIGVVLSGTGSDGSRGVRAIHAEGGLVVCQAPETARFDGMPRTTLATGVVDLTLAPEAMPEAVSRYTEHLADVGARIEAVPLVPRDGESRIQATHEELVASNEELQSTNEELQSANEALYTVNAELQKKIDQLTELTTDMDNLLSSTEVGTIFLDRDLRIRKFTPRIARSFRLQPQDVGRHIADFTYNLDRADIVEDLRLALTEGRRIEEEVRDRRGRWFLLRVLPYRIGERIDGVVLTLVDIGAVKRAEGALFRARHLLESLMETLPDAMYFCDDAGRVVRVNEGFARRLGLSGPEEAVGRLLRDVWSGPDGERAAERNREVLESGRTTIDELERLRRADGRLEWLLTTRLALRDESGGVVGTFAISRDVTRQKEAEERAQEAVRRRDVFLATLSHELRNPLNAILGSAGLLDAPGSTEAMRARAREVIRRQSAQMSRLLGDLLDVSRVTRDKIELRKATVDVRDVCGEAAAAVEGDFARRGVRLHTQLSEAPVLVAGDRARLQQICVNLLSNAAKFSPAGSVVRLALRAEGAEAVLAVADHGVGVAPEMLETIFEPFVQVRGDADEGGMGLGLPLVRSLTEMHGGRVNAESGGPGRGTVFTVRLPRILEDTEGRPPQAEPGGIPQGTSLVIVEDMEDNREALAAVLALAGFEVHAAEDGPSGAELIERLRPRVALVDVGLPGLDGYGVAERVRARLGPDVRLVALTGYGRREDRRRAAEAGFDAHVVKPVDARELEAVLAGLLET